MSSTRAQEARLLGILFSQLGEKFSRQELTHRTWLKTVELEERLRTYLAAGYPIQFHPGGELSLDQPGDIWSAEEILGRLGAGTTWDPLLLAETGSTNDVVREQARRGGKEGFLVAASRQTQGRGRLGRVWDSPAQGGLYVSLLLRPKMALHQAGRLAILASLAAVDAVESVAGIRPQLKWPNDLHWQGRKLAGLLVETEPAGDQLGWAVIGLGLNVRQRREDFSPPLQNLATSLFLMTGNEYRRVDLLLAYVLALELRLAQPFAQVREEWEANCLTLGQQVSLTTADGVRHGQAAGLNESGALLLRRDSGEVETVTAGDMQAV